jgi:hypothetical protein
MSSYTPPSWSIFWLPKVLRVGEMRTTTSIYRMDEMTDGYTQKQVPQQDEVIILDNIHNSPNYVSSVLFYSVLLCSVSVPSSVLHEDILLAQLHFLLFELDVSHHQCHHYSSHFNTPRLNSTNLTPEGKTELQLRNPKLRLLPRALRRLSIPIRSLHPRTLGPLLSSPVLPHALLPRHPAPNSLHPDRALQPLIRRALGRRTQHHRRRPNRDGNRRHRNLQRCTRDHCRLAHEGRMA